MSDPAVRKQYLIFGGIFTAIFVVLGLGYLLFLRADYSVLASGLRPEDASAIVAELDKRGTPYRIEDGGGTIQVPAGEADATKVAIAGSDAAARGQIGFELFNKSDMGLTNFAQKINYLRALQGELVRTITAMDGVDTARVHLALPERSLFRGERVESSAAVTVTMKQGRIADPARVAGIQRLVAAAVPDLSGDRVVVLDGQGRAISATAAPAEVASELDEQQAIQAYYAARARAVVEPILGEGKFGIRALAQTRGGGSELSDPGASGADSTRGFALRVLVVTPSRIPADEQAVVRDAIAQSIKADMGRGDTVEFEVGPLMVAPAAIAPSIPPRAAPVERFEQEALSGDGPLPVTPLVPGWLWVVLSIGAALLAAMLLLRRRARMTGEEHQSFAARLQRQLAITEETADAERR
ncbi:flagellar basal-body MS-ring/collar protein FliF [Sphingomonas koreensis]